MKMMSKLKYCLIHVLVIIVADDFIVLWYQVHRLVEKLVFFLVDGIKTFIFWMVLVHLDQIFHNLIDVIPI